MDDFDQVLSRADRLLEQSSPPPGELRRLSVDLDDLINSPQFQTLDADARAAVQKRFQEVRARLRGGDLNAVPSPGAMPPLPEATSATPSRPRAEERQHNPYAQESMEEAEKLFYGGRYTELIKLYDQVLTIEPDWDRARQHRSEAEGYLRTGYIPAVALPAEAASAFGKAQSAARLGRYQDAMALLIAFAEYPPTIRHSTLAGRHRVRAEAAAKYRRGKCVQRGHAVVRPGSDG